MGKEKIIGIDLTIAPYGEMLTEVARLARARISSYVCFANVHMCIEAFLDGGIAQIVNNADIAAPDGMPLVKSLKLFHGINQDRVAGMDLFPDLLAEAERQGLSVFFYGSSPEVLAKIEERTRREHPELEIAGVFSPPFRQLFPVEEQAHVDLINDSGANMVMVALGCPKQEIWMAKHKGIINAVMVGVGGAFPVYAGLQERAPEWMQKASLEWLFRLKQEPRRMLKRYVVTNSLFTVLITWQFLKKQLQANSFHKSS